MLIVMDGNNSGGSESEPLLIDDVAVSVRMQHGMQKFNTFFFCFRSENKSDQSKDKPIYKLTTAN